MEGSVASTHDGDDPGDERDKRCIGGKSVGVASLPPILVPPLAAETES